MTNTTKRILPGNFLFSPVNIFCLSILTILIIPATLHASGGGDDGGSDDGHGTGAMPGTITSGTRPDGSVQVTHTMPPDRDGVVTIAVSESATGWDGPFEVSIITVYPDSGSDDSYFPPPIVNPSSNGNGQITALSSCRLSLGATVCEDITASYTLFWETFGNLADLDIHAPVHIINLKNNTPEQEQASDGVYTYENRTLSSPVSGITFSGIPSNSRIFELRRRYVSGTEWVRMDTKTAQIECLAGIPAGNTCVCPVGEFPNTDNTSCVSYVVPTVSFIPSAPLVRSGASTQLFVDVTVDSAAVIECRVTPATQITGENTQSLVFTTGGTQRLAFDTVPLRSVTNFSVECYDVSTPTAPRISAQAAVKVVPNTMEI